MVSVYKGIGVKQNNLTINYKARCEMIVTVARDLEAYTMNHHRLSRLNFPS